MKARILTAILLMSALTTFAQTSRRDNSERRNNDNNNSSTTNVEQRTTDQQNSGNNSNQERRSTVNTNNDARNNSSQESRTNGDQRRYNPSQESRATVDQRRDHSTNNANTSNDERRSNQSDYNRQNSDERRGETPSRMREGDHDHDKRYDSRDNRRDWNHSDNRVVVRNRYDSHPRRVVIVDRHYNRPANRHVITYRAPVRRDIFWSVSMSRDFRMFYPEIHTWRYTNGYRIPTIPAYDAWDYAGEIAHIYGRVQDIYFEPDADEFYLYFGDYYPRQDLTIVIPGNIARQYSGNPFRYFQDQYVSASGYIQMFDGRPEMLIRSTRQMDIY